MRTIRIENSGKIIIDGDIVDLSKIDNKESFISSIMMLDVELANDVSVSDIIHFFYDAKILIKNIFSEEYETVRAMATSSVLSKNHKSLKLYKSFKVENELLDENKEFIYMIPEIEFIESSQGEDGVRLLGSLTVDIDENIKLVHNGVVIESKTKLSLLDLMTCLFDELPSILKEGFILS